MVPNPVWVAYSRLAIKDFGGAEGLRRQLVLLRDFILNRNTKSHQAQRKKFYALKPFETWGKLHCGLEQELYTSPYMAQACFQSQSVPRPTTKRQEKANLPTSTSRLLSSTSHSKGVSNRSAKICKYGSHGHKVTVAEDIREAED